MSEILKECGRETAQGLLSKAVDTADHTDQMMNQLFIAEWAANHILATMIYNHIKQGGRNLTSCLEEITNNIAKEYELLNEGEDMEFTPKAMKQ